MRYDVSPLPDSVDQRYGWQVKANGRRMSTHYKKSGAVRAAKRKADGKDSIVVHRTDGTIQKTI